MATTYKVLGQVNPSAVTQTTVYTVPSATQAVISTIVVTNLGSTATSYRIAVQPAGASLVQKHYIAYDITVPALDSTALTIGMTLATTDIVSVWSYSGLVNFNIFGSEIA